MAQNLQLQIYRIAIRKRNAKKEKEFLNFEDLFKSIKEDKKEAYNQFVSDYRNLFNGKFQSDGTGTKSISTTSKNEFAIRSQSNIIDGEVFGGSIGNVQTIYNQDNADEEVGKINFDQIASLPFYIKLWTPYDYSAGILMVQNYTDYTVTELIKVTLRKFFADYGFTLVIFPFTPEIVKETYLKKSHVYEMRIIQDVISRGKRKLLNPLFVDFQNLKIEIKVTGFKSDVKTFWNFFKKSKNEIIGSNLEDLDILPESNYDIKAYYKDEEGHSASVGIGNIYDISPTIFLPDELKCTKTHHFIFKKIKSNTDVLLDKIQKEIKYK